MCDFPPKYTFLSVMPSKREDALLWYQDPGNSSANHDNHTNTKYPPQTADSRLVLLYKKWTWIFFKRTTLPLPNQSKTSSTDGRIEVWKIYPLSYLEIELQKLTRHWCWVEPLPYPELGGVCCYYFKADMSFYHENTWNRKSINHYTGYNITVPWVATMVSRSIYNVEASVHNITWIATAYVPSTHWSNTVKI